MIGKDPNTIVMQITLNRFEHPHTCNVLDRIDSPKIRAALMKHCLERWFSAEAQLRTSSDRQIVDRTMPTGRSRALEKGPSIDDTEQLSTHDFKEIFGSALDCEP